tara:strand:- start:174 stop:455 length:282 start_codon:yes stop_codon:yes gene_type:complete
MRPSSTQGESPKPYTLMSERERLRVWLNLTETEFHETPLQIQVPDLKLWFNRDGDLTRVMNFATGISSKASDGKISPIHSTSMDGWRKAHGLG